MILFTADDFGASREVNAAVVKAHKAGTLHAASLMMGESGAEEAVALAKENPSLRVGLHLALVDAKSVLPHSEIPSLVDSDRNFPKNPAYTWLAYLFNPRLASQLEKEIRAQFDAFRKTGLKLSHVDGHHHQHIHPRAWRLAVELAKAGGAEWVRLPREDIGVWSRCAAERQWWKILHGKIYRGLTSGKPARLENEGFLRFDAVYGILETFSLNKEFVLNLLKQNLSGINELYFHPGVAWNKDLEILLDPEVIAETKKQSLRDPWSLRA